MSGTPRRRLGALIAAAVTLAAVLVPTVSSHGRDRATPATPATPATVVIDGKRMRQARISLDAATPRSVRRSSP